MASPASRPYFKLSYFTFCSFLIFSFPYLLWATRFWHYWGQWLGIQPPLPLESQVPYTSKEPTPQSSLHCILHNVIFCLSSGFLQSWKHLTAFWAVHHLLLLPLLEFHGPRSPVSFPCRHTSLSWGFSFNVFLSWSYYWFFQCLCL